MCFPALLATIPAAAGAIGSASLGTAATVAGTALSAGGAILGGIQQNAAGKAQQQADNQQANTVRATGEYQAARKQDQINQTIGQQIAAVGGSGVTLSGSPTDVVASTASEGALDVGAIRWGAKVQSDDLRYQGKLASFNGGQALAGGFLGAASAIAGGLGKLGGVPDTVYANPTGATRLGTGYGASFSRASV